MPHMVYAQHCTSACKGETEHCQHRQRAHNRVVLPPHRCILGTLWVDLHLPAQGQHLAALHQGWHPSLARCSLLHAGLAWCLWGYSVAPVTLELRLHPFRRLWCHFLRTKDCVWRQRRERSQANSRQRPRQWGCRRLVPCSHNPWQVCNTSKFRTVGDRLEVRQVGDWPKVGQVGDGCPWDRWQDWE